MEKKPAATDRLIDQVVYRLYALKGEEIAVVVVGEVVGIRPAFKGQSVIFRMPKVG